MQDKIDDDVNISHSSEKMNTDKKSSEMWNTLVKTGSIYGLMLNCSNAIYQLQAIADPYSERH